MKEQLEELLHKYKTLLEEEANKDIDKDVFADFLYGVSEGKVQTYAKIIKDLTDLVKNIGKEES
nr:MAG TPA: hypothetical protein [Caudoviricetes sp.]